MYERFISSSMLTGIFEAAMSVIGESCRCPRSALDIQVLDVESVVLDELAPRLDLVAHQRGEHEVGLRMIFGFHLQQRALRGIHRRLPQRVRVHLAEALVAVDGNALLAGGDEEL